jgi:hypothetical protein
VIYIYIYMVFEGYFGKNMIEELKEKCALYGLTIVKSMICVPSNLLFMSIFAPSRYESKLWDLKYHLKDTKFDSNLEKHKIEKIKLELEDFNKRYSVLFSGHFESAIKYMLNEKGRRIEMLDHKYGYFLSAAVDWELIRTQPMRYIWNETEQIALYGIGLSGIFGVNAILREGVVTTTNKPNPQLQAIKLIKDQLYQLDTIKLLVNGKYRITKHKETISKSIRKYKIYQSISKSMPKIRYRLILLNFGNFCYMLGGYKPPKKKCNKSRDIKE